MQNRLVLSGIWILLSFIPSSLFPANSAGTTATQTKPLPEIHEEIQVDLVNVYMTALDSKDKFVTDLKPEELALKEDGIPREISNFVLSSRTSDPLTVAILIDTSLSMNEEFQNMKKLEMAKKGAISLLGQLKSQDKTFMIRFSGDPSDSTVFVSDKNEMKDLVRSLKTDSGLTPLLDTIDQTVDRLQSVPGQKLLFICSDGEDTASKHTKEEVLKRLDSISDLTVVALGINAFRADPNSEVGQTLRDGRTLLQSIADNTGGYAFFPSDLAELDVVMRKLKSLIASQYSLGYPPNIADADGWRKIEITCSRPGVTLRYRPGYFSK